MFITVAHTKFCKSPVGLISYEDLSIYPPHNGFIAIMFSAHVSGSWSTFKMASHTPFMGSIQAENGIRSTYSQAIKNATGQAKNHRIRNHRMAHRMPGHSPPPFPLPSPCPIKAACYVELCGDLEKKKISMLLELFCIIPRVLHDSFNASLTVLHDSFSDLDFMLY